MLFCFFTNILYYWFTPAVILLVPFLINVLGSKMAQYFHIFYGIVISLFLLINISIYPISLLFGDVDRETAILFGWDKITKIVDEEKKLHGTEKIVFSDYRMGSLYIFHSGDFEADVVMENRLTQFDVWRDKEKPYANKTLIITDDDFPIGQKILSKFDTIEFIKDIGIYIGDKLVRKYKVYLGISHS